MSRLLLILNNSRAKKDSVSSNPEYPRTWTSKECIKYGRSWVQVPVR